MGIAVGTHACGQNPRHRPCSLHFLRWRWNSGTGLEANSRGDPVMSHGPEGPGKFLISPARAATPVLAATNLPAPALDHGRCRQAHTHGHATDTDPRMAPSAYRAIVSLPCRSWRDRGYGRWTLA